YILILPGSIGTISSMLRDRVLYILIMPGMTFHDSGGAGTPTLQLGGSAALLADALHDRLSCNHPALGGTRHPPQLAWRDLEQFLPTENVFDDERSLLPPSRDIAHTTFGLDQFVELEPAHFARSPTLMLTVQAIETLILAPG